MQRKQSWGLKARTNTGLVVVLCYSENEPAFLLSFLFLLSLGTQNIEFTLCVNDDVTMEIYPDHVSKKMLILFTLHLFYGSFKRQIWAFVCSVAVIMVFVTFHCWSLHRKMKPKYFQLPLLSVIVWNTETELTNPNRTRRTNTKTLYRCY